MSSTECEEFYNMEPAAVVPGKSSRGRTIKPTPKMLAPPPPKERPEVELICQPKKTPAEEIAAMNAAYMKNLEIQANQNKRKLDKETEEESQGPKKRTKPERKKRGMVKFDERLEQLRQFRRQHGHLNVPNNAYADNGVDEETDGLGKWCKYVRSQYRIFKQDHDQKPEFPRSTLTLENIFALIDLGFQFVLKPKDTLFTWEERMKQCQEFKAENGHLKIPLQHDLLGNFCGKVRDNCRLKREGKKNTLTDEREKQLTDMGFVFQVGKSQPKKAPNVPWKERFEEFKQYVQKHGDPHVPVKYPTGLGEWVKYQRRHYRWMMAGEKRSSLTTERFQLLNSAGFAWVAQGKVSTKNKESTQDDDDEGESDNDEPPRPLHHFQHYGSPPTARLCER